MPGRTPRCPTSARRGLLSLIGCRVQVRDAEGVLVLTWDGVAWSLPAVGAELFAPLVQSCSSTSGEESVYDVGAEGHEVRTN